MFLREVPSLQAPRCCDGWLCAAVASWPLVPIQVVLTAFPDKSRHRHFYKCLFINLFLTAGGSGYCYPRFENLALSWNWPAVHSVDAILEESRGEPGAGRRATTPRFEERPVPLWNEEIGLHVQRGCSVWLYCQLSWSPLWYEHRFLLVWNSRLCSVILHIDHLNWSVTLVNWVRWIGIDFCFCFGGAQWPVLYDGI